MPAIFSYQDLEVWKRSMLLVPDVYRVCKLLPADERFGLIAQLRRSAVSIPSNIAEGYHRSTRREYRRYVQQAYGSCAELETQMLIVKQLEMIDSKTVDLVFNQIQTIMRMLNALVRRLG